MSAKKEEKPVPKLYILKNRVFYKHNLAGTYLYTVEIFKYTTEGKHFRMELMGNDVFEVDKFLGLTLREFKGSKEAGVSYSKDATLLAAPQEFIDMNRAQPFKYEEKKKATKKAQ
jgi:hypothetical protein